MRPFLKILLLITSRHRYQPTVPSRSLAIKSSFKPFLICLTIAAIFGSTTKHANALENGKPDSAYENVGVLGFVSDAPMFPDEPVGICSGFVISDRAFVTAAHCITPVEGIAQSWAVTLEPGSPDDPIIPPGTLNLATFNVQDFPILVETVSTTTIQLHPQFDPETLENDVAVLEFPAGTFDVPPVRLARFTLLNWLKGLRILRKLPIGVVGYGADQFLGDLNFSIPGYRSRGFSTIGTLSRTRLTLESTPVLDANILPGDSGSPQFVLGLAISLASSSDFQRLDTHAVRRFLAPFAR